MAEISYAEHLTQRKKQALGAEAEYQGWLMAKTCMEQEPPPYSSDEYLQRRYYEGFQDGRIVLACEEETQP
jgi:hypothetical protein